MFLLLCAVAALAHANGANDNWKGVATLYGSGTLSFRAALRLATGATLLGSVLSIVLAASLLRGFSGKGLVPEAMTSTPAFLIAVAAGAAATVLSATRLGLPTSTTHALIGALLGISLLVGGDQGSGQVLWELLLRPLLLSPLLAATLAAVAYLVLAGLRRRTGAQPESCLCVEPVDLALMRASATDPVMATQSTGAVRLTIGTAAECNRTTAAGAPALRLTASLLLNSAHVVSGATVCFARAVNDTPKIAALAVAAGSATSWPFLLVATAMVGGGLFGVRRVAETMSHRLSTMNAGQGATGNLVTAGLVLGASSLGLPVSTTHVSCGAIAGIGLVTRRADFRVLRNVLLAWVATLPLAALCGALFYQLLR